MKRVLVLIRDLINEFDVVFDKIQVGLMFVECYEDIIGFLLNLNKNKNEVNDVLLKMKSVDFLVLLKWMRYGVFSQNYGG